MRIHEASEAFGRNLRELVKNAYDGLDPDADIDEMNGCIVGELLGSAISGAVDVGLSRNEFFDIASQAWEVSKKRKAEGR